MFRKVTLVALAAIIFFGSTAFTATQKSEATVAWADYMCFSKLEKHDLSNELKNSLFIYTVNSSTYSKISGTREFNKITECVKLNKKQVSDQIAVNYGVLYEFDVNSISSLDMIITNLKYDISNSPWGRKTTPTELIIAAHNQNLYSVATIQYKVVGSRFVPLQDLGHPGNGEYGPRFFEQRELNRWINRF